MKQGTILQSAWGYEQTNVTFYRVIKRTAKMVTLVKIKSERTDLGNMVYSAVPIEEDDGVPFTRKVLYYRDEPMVKINSYARAYEWTSRPVGGSSYA